MAPQAPSRLFDDKGQSVDLGRQIAAGGQGAIHEVAARPNLVAKLYFTAPDPRTARKLAVLPNLGTPPLAKIAAWPTSALFDRPQGAVRGLLMPRVVAHREIHELYSPAHRKKEFPRATWQFLVRAARNLAAAVDTIHAHGHVIGDVNQKGFLVSPTEATIKVIDCDSFQVDAYGEQFGCPVGVSHFTPPELQGRSFEGLKRSKNHDSFGLAVLCFHLLFSGRHPFVGRFRGPGDMPVERAIAEFRFAFGSGAAAHDMEPPPHVLRLTQLTPEVASLFERAFDRAGANERGRPSAAQWIQGLDALERQLRPCDRDDAHWYLPARGPCPWCEIERATGLVLFLCWEPGGARTGGCPPISTFNLERIWADVAAVAAPGPSPAESIQPIRKIVATPLPTAFRLARLSFVAIGLAVTAAFVTFGLQHMENGGLAPTGGGLLVGVLASYGYGRFDFRGERRRRATELAEAKREWEQAAEAWTNEASDGRFNEFRSVLESARNAYLALPGEYAQEVKRLEDQKRGMQLAQFLESQFIDLANIRGIGPSRRAALASYGIETAADIESSRIQGVPGFGPSLTSELLRWRVRVEASFRFDPSKAIDPREKAAIDARYVRRRRELEAQLVGGANELEQIRRSTLTARSRLWGRIRQARSRFAQAEADAALLRFVPKA